MVQGKHIGHILHNCEVCLNVIRLLMQRQASARAARRGGAKQDKPYILTAMDKFLRKK